MKAAIYARVSGDDTKTATSSIEAQLVDGRKQLAINEYEAAIVRTLYHLYANEGYTLYQLKDYLDSNGIVKPGVKGNYKGQRISKNRAADPGWSVGTIGMILSSETYNGRWYYRKTKRTKIGAGKYKQIKRPRSEWLMVEVPAIIDDELFSQVQTRRELNKRQKGKQKKHLYVLGGMLKCGHCGVNVSGVTKVKGGGHWGYYKCNARHLPKKFGYRCELPQFRVVDVDAVVWNWIRGIMLDPDKLRKALEGYKDQQTDASDPLLHMLEANEAKLAQLEEEKERLIKAYSKGKLTLDDISKIKVSLDRQITALKGAIGSLRGELQERIFTIEEMAAIETLAGQYREEVALCDDDPAAQRHIMQLLAVEAVLSVEDENKWVDVSCKLGRKRYALDSTRILLTDKYCILRTRLPVGAGHTLAGQLFSTAKLVVESAT